MPADERMMSRPMSSPSPEVLAYKRSRFSTRLPVGRLYTPSHFWLLEESSGIYRVGFTKFATRMLGELVEYGFQTNVGAAVTVGQQIGWVEGFKAITDLYCVADGSFEGGNPELEQDATLTDTDPYGRGWLYRVCGKPEANAVDVQGYMALLDLTIDKMQSKGGAEAALEGDDEGETKKC
jgi:glycine cleavage system H protein